MPHDSDHVERVKRLALFIAEREGGDLEVIRTAAELHDVARDEDNHAIRGAEVARKILMEKGHDEKFIEEVCHCIEAHSFSSGIEPRTLEAKILSDADKLDAMGAIGVARVFMYSGERGRSIEDTLRHFEEKLLRLQSMMHTETGRKIAAERHRFLEEFYRRIKTELRLEDIRDI
ncbi:putative HD superfamily hydrolase [Geoglobus ahangari]|uniref:Putative HD superfamily hydrolase n=1 Tax=Geoglobus ahangari TaxID=113653 RepID=A0A0F7IEP2_9EURY|nr:HD domain-containing protein [Geoglobus ahangari]AKG91472.1 putative HD superfamily hydrolase [Geoglobus ahangari]